ncbi:hypothetical protein KQH52_08435 [Mycetohabitans sp. B7]|nr:hypothetical protein [Mycetohabitans sp. B7]
MDNDQARYTFDNHLGSSTLELDNAAQLLTYEEYYPYGGTALWSAKSELEAKYKTVRYSGKERDATGLYYYGFRYYAPWLGRWLNPDPAETVDGLNLFSMVRNNPIKLIDEDGLIPVQPDIFEKVVSGIKYGQKLNETVELSSEKLISNEKNISVKQHKQYLNELAATAQAQMPSKGLKSKIYQNIRGSLAKKDRFPGISIDDPKKPIYKINDIELFVNEIKGRYRGDSENPQEMHPYVESKLRKHIETNGEEISTFVGIPALHAEVRALNDVLNQLSPNDIPSYEELSEIMVSTYKLGDGVNKENLYDLRIYKEEKSIGRFHVTVYAKDSSSLLESLNREKYQWKFDGAISRWVKAEKRGISQPGTQSGPFVACTNCQAFLRSTRILTDIKR